MPEPTNMTDARWRAGRVSCFMCDHRWVAVRPADAAPLECPHCGGYYGGPIYEELPITAADLATLDARTTDGEPSLTPTERRYAADIRRLIFALRPYVEETPRV